MAKPGPEREMASPVNTGDSAQGLQLSLGEPVVDRPSESNALFTTAPACFIRQGTSQPPNAHP